MVPSVLPGIWAYRRGIHWCRRNDLACGTSVALWSYVILMLRSRKLTEESSSLTVQASQVWLLILVVKYSKVAQEFDSAVFVRRAIKLSSVQRRENMIHLENLGRRWFISGKEKSTDNASYWCAHSYSSHFFPWASPNWSELLFNFISNTFNVSSIGNLLLTHMKFPLSKFRMLLMISSFSILVHVFFVSTATSWYFCWCSLSF